MNSVRSSPSRHHGVGLVVTNPTRSRFLLQQKDANYPAYPLRYSFFGGQREHDETNEAAVRREVEEELGPDAARWLSSIELVEVYDGRIEAPPRSFRFTLLEAVVEDATLDRLGALEVLEGERAAIFARSELNALSFIWSLEHVMQKYLTKRPRDAF